MAPDPKIMPTGELVTELHHLIWFGNLFSASDNDRYRAVRAEYERRKVIVAPPAEPHRPDTEE